LLVAPPDHRERRPDPTGKPAMTRAGCQEVLGSTPLTSARCPHYNISTDLALFPASDAEARKCFFSNPRLGDCFYSVSEVSAAEAGLGQGQIPQIGTRAGHAATHRNRNVAAISRAKDSTRSQRITDRSGNKAMAGSVLGSDDPGSCILPGRHNCPVDGTTAEKY
jgi:hypothetical protein